jgi:hypothetical protein
MTARPIAIAALVLLSACNGNSPLDTVDQERLSRAPGPNGLEQRLTLAVDPEGFRDPVYHTLLVTSDIVNTGTAPVQVTTRVCLFFESDVQISAEADRYEPLMTCGAVQARNELPPGESVGPMEVRYRIRSGPGVYTVRVRQALDPAFSAEASFRIP